MGERLMIRPHTGKPFPGALGLSLLTDDVIDVPAASFAVVETLRNKCLARIDEELALQVTELAVYSASRCGEPAERQLQALVTQTELTDGRTRVVGYRAGASAAETVATTPEKKVAAEQKPSAPPPAAQPAPARATAPPPPSSMAASAPSPSLNATGASPPAPELKREMAPSRPPALAAARDSKSEREPSHEPPLPGRPPPEPPASGPGGAADIQFGKGKANALAWWIVRGGERLAQKGPAPKFASAAAANPELMNCLAILLAGAGAPNTGPVLVLARIQGQRVVRAVVGGLPLPPSCAALVGPEATGAPDGWIGFEVRLP
jgi:hypothetical protein